MLQTKRANRHDIRNGKYKEFNKHGVLIAEGVYLNGRKHGTWREYYDDSGSVMIEENFRHGIHEGRFASYHPNGKLCSEGHFQNGLREGDFRVFDETGREVKVLRFVHDIEVTPLPENVPAAMAMREPPARAL